MLENLKEVGLGHVVLRSVKVALMIGTILTLINHYGEIFNGNLSAVNAFQIILTYVVPFCVSFISVMLHMNHYICVPRNKK